jgi:hypothetical protein
MRENVSFAIIVKDLDSGEGKSCVSEPLLATRYLRWQGEKAAREAGLRELSAVEIGRRARGMRKCGKLAESSFAHVGPNITIGQPYRKVVISSYCYGHEKRPIALG